MSKDISNPPSPEMGSAPTRAMDEPFARRVLMSPLHWDIAAESTTNSWTQWNGYTVPACLTRFETEYQALRYGLAMADFSPLPKYHLSGRDALAYLNRLVTGDVASLAIGTAMPVLFCEDHGLVVGEGRLYRIADETYRLVTSEPHFAWLLDSALGFQVQVEDVTPHHACIALMGPLAAPEMSRLLTAEAPAQLGAGKSIETKLGGMPVFIIANDAQSPASGYEVWMDADDASSVWRLLRRELSQTYTRPIGMDVLDLARLEAGVARAGQEYHGAFSAVLPEQAITPSELGATARIDFGKGHFTGRQALVAQRLTLPSRQLVLLQIEGFEPAVITTVCAGGMSIGRVTSFGFSPARGANLAFATLPTAALAKATKKGAAMTVQSMDANGVTSTKSAQVIAPNLGEPSENRL